MVPQGHRLARATGGARSRMLADESILLPRATMNAGNVVADALRRAGVRAAVLLPRQLPRADQGPGAGRGLGVAPMPKMLVAPETLDGLVAIPFEKPLYRDLDIIYPRDRPLPAAARALMAHVRAALAGRAAYGADPVRHARRTWSRSPVTPCRDQLLYALVILRWHP